MTEAEWLACGNAQLMLEFLSGKVSDRKLHLFVCACCRKVWHLLTDERSRKAVEVAEASTDRLASQEVVEAMRQAAWDAWKDAATIPLRIAAWNAMQATARNPAKAAVSIAAREAGGTDQPHLLRDVFGNPFRPAPATSPDWLAWNHGTAGRLAAAAYEERDLPSGHLVTQRLLLLADALGDSGCDDAELLGHLRGPGPHVRGCWAVDLLTGRA